MLVGCAVLLCVVLSFVLLCCFDLVVCLIGWFGWVLLACWMFVCLDFSWFVFGCMLVVCFDRLLSFCIGFTVSFDFGLGLSDLFGLLYVLLGLG